MADLFAGPNVPSTKAFLFCGWRALPVDWELDHTHDLSSPSGQALLHEQLRDADCIVAAFDCSTKSRAREIPRVFSDGRPAPKPLHTETFPEGLPHLPESQARRVDVDNRACSFVLEEIENIQKRGGISIRENPFNSLHWFLAKEVEMMASGIWSDTPYAACFPRSMTGHHCSATIATTLRNGNPMRRMARAYIRASLKQNIRRLWRSPWLFQRRGGLCEQDGHPYMSHACRQSPAWGAGNTGSSWTHALSGSGPWPL